MPTLNQNHLKNIDKFNKLREFKKKVAVQTRLLVPVVNKIRNIKTNQTDLMNLNSNTKTT